MPVITPNIPNMNTFRILYLCVYLRYVRVASS